jgi:hypothetical protein
LLLLLHRWLRLRIHAQREHLLIAWMAHSKLSKV